INLQGIKNQGKHTQIWTDIPFIFYWSSICAEQGTNGSLSCKQVLYCKILASLYKLPNPPPSLSPLILLLSLIPFHHELYYIIRSSWNST
ncbi:unnamed protein product, partial [Prunus brigantina]